jgi:hypothetical protein
MSEETRAGSYLNGLSREEHYFLGNVIRVEGQTALLL